MEIARDRVVVEFLADMTQLHRSLRSIPQTAQRAGQSMRAALGVPVQQAQASFSGLNHETTQLGDNFKLIERNLGTFSRGFRRASMNLMTGVKGFDMLSIQLDRASMAVWKFTIAAMPFRMVAQSMSLVALASGAVGVSLVKAAAWLQVTRRQFIEFSDSVYEANSNIEYLRDQAPKIVGTLQEVMESGRLLTAAGYEIRDLVHPMADLTAGINQEGIDIVSATRAFIDAMHGEFRRLKNTFNISREDVAKYADGAMNSMGQIVDKAALQMGILEAIQEKYPNANKAALESVLGDWSNFKDEISRLAQDLGQVILPFARELVGAFRGVVEWVRQLSDSSKAVLVWGMAIGGAASAAAALFAGLAQVALTMAGIWAFGKHMAEQNKEMIELELRLMDIERRAGEARAEQLRQEIALMEIRLRLERAHIDMERSAAYLQEKAPMVFASPLVRGGGNTLQAPGGSNAHVRAHVAAYNAANKEIVDAREHMNSMLAAKSLPVLREELGVHRELLSTARGRLDAAERHFEAVQRQLLTQQGRAQQLYPGATMPDIADHPRYARAYGRVVERESQVEYLRAEDLRMTRKYNEALRQSKSARQLTENYNNLSASTGGVSSMFWGLGRSIGSMLIHTVAVGAAFAVIHKLWNSGKERLEKFADATAKATETLSELSVLRVGGEMKDAATALNEGAQAWKDMDIGGGGMLTGAAPLHELIGGEYGSVSPADVALIRRAARAYAKDPSQWTASERAAHEMGLVEPVTEPQIRILGRRPLDEQLTGETTDYAIEQLRAWDMARRAFEAARINEDALSRLNRYNPQAEASAKRRLQDVREELRLYEALGNNITMLQIREQERLTATELQLMAVLESTKPAVELSKVDKDRWESKERELITSQRVLEMMDELKESDAARFALVSQTRNELSENTSVMTELRDIAKEVAQYDEVGADEHRDKLESLEKEVQFAQDLLNIAAQMAQLEFGSKIGDLYGASGGEKGVLGRVRAAREASVARGWYSASVRSTDPQDSERFYNRALDAWIRMARAAEDYRETINKVREDGLKLSTDEITRLRSLAEHEENLAAQERDRWKRQQAALYEGGASTQEIDEARWVSETKERTHLANADKHRRQALVKEYDMQINYLEGIKQRIDETSKSVEQTAMVEREIAKLKVYQAQATGEVHKYSRAILDMQATYAKTEVAIIQGRTAGLQLAKEFYSVQGMTVSLARNATQMLATNHMYLAQIFASQGNITDSVKEQLEARKEIVGLAETELEVAMARLAYVEKMVEYGQASEIQLEQARKAALVESNQLLQQYTVGSIEWYRAAGQHADILYEKTKRTFGGIVAEILGAPQDLISKFISPASMAGVFGINNLGSMLSDVASGVDASLIGAGNGEITIRVRYSGDSDAIQRKVNEAAAAIGRNMAYDIARVLEQA